MWPDVISSGQAVCITVKSGQCTKICLTLFTNVHRAHYIMCSKMCTMHLTKLVHPHQAELCTSCPG